MVVEELVEDETSSGLLTLRLEGDRESNESNSLQFRRTLGQDLTAESREERSGIETNCLPLIRLPKLVVNLESILESEIGRVLGVLLGAGEGSGEVVRGRAGIAGVEADGFAEVLFEDWAGRSRYRGREG
jgi:hypothetical protein